MALWPKPVPLALVALRRQVTSVHVSPCDRYRIFAITCPFALCNTAGRERVLAAYAAEPAAGVHALVLEHIAVSLNPRQGLAAGERLTALLAATGQHRDVLSAFAATLERMPWRVYKVRRVIRPRVSDPARPANASRSLRAVAAGSRTQMAAVLRTMAQVEDASVEDEDGIERAWLRRRGAGFRPPSISSLPPPPGQKTRTAPVSRRLAGGNSSRRRPARASRQAAPAPPDLDSHGLTARSLPGPTPAPSRAARPSATRRDTRIPASES